MYRAGLWLQIGVDMLPRVTLDKYQTRVLRSTTPSWKSRGCWAHARGYVGVFPMMIWGAGRLTCTGRARKAYVCETVLLWAA